MKGRKKANCLWTLGFEEQHGCEFSGFSLGLLYLEHVAWRVSNPKTPMGTKKIIQEMLAFFSQISEKGATEQDRKYLINNCHTSGKYWNTSTICVGFFPLHQTIHLIYTGKTIWMTVNISSATTEARKKWHNISQVLLEITTSPIFYFYKNNPSGANGKWGHYQRKTKIISDYQNYPKIMGKWVLEIQRKL